ncbi:unnamed protein product [Phyllotreta striolata]|uniref:Uncharacterized protein n=1 Tax=Phyllotreta striolata TaxID=444603 RepID=A0A9N9XPV9_PHYSR|nr:unnamed protein product [Phyllotreta striolata]
MVNILPVLLLCLLHQVQGQTHNTTTTTNATTPAPEETFEYLVKFVFGLETEKIPGYLLDTIFNGSANTTTEDMIALYGLQNVNLSATVEVLERLRYDTSRIFSIDGLSVYLSQFRVGFKDFYNSVLMGNLGITGLPLRNFLVAFGVRTGDFSDAMTFGEPDPWEVFKRGTFNETTLEMALGAINRTRNELFEACRDHALDIVRSKSRREFLEILKSHNFDRVEAKNLWDIMELDVENVENVTAFKDLLDNIKLTLENSTFLGVLTGKRVAVNKDVYSSIKEELELSKMYAQSPYDNTTVEVTIDKPHYKDIVTFSLEEDNFTTFIEAATSDRNLDNCVFVTLENEAVVHRQVESAVKEEDGFEVEAGDLNITDLMPGSPLVCGNKVYGLAKEIDDDRVIFDGFGIDSGSMMAVLNPVLVLVCLMVYLQ